MPRTTRPIALTEEEISTFWSHVDFSGGDDSCWPWTGRRYEDVGLDAKPYGTFLGESAHRIAFFLGTDEQPGRKQVQHSCNFGLCCNPTHLSTGDHKRNTEHMLKCGRHNPATGPRNKITDEQKQFIKDSSMTNLQLQRITKLSLGTIRRIRKST